MRDGETTWIALLRRFDEVLLELSVWVGVGGQLEVLGGSATMECVEDLPEFVFEVFKHFLLQRIGRTAVSGKWSGNSRGHRVEYVVVWAWPKGRVKDCVLGFCFGI